MLLSNQIRKSGIEPIGDITWGTHISHIYSSKDEFAELLAPFIKEGLLNNELCIWIYSPNISRREIMEIIGKIEIRIDTFISSGQLIIIPYTEWYILDGCFDGARVTSQWLELINRAQKNGYEGVRAVGDTYWLTYYSEEFANYERSISSLIYKLPFTVICSYDINQIDIHEFEDIINNHSLNMIKTNNQLQVIKNNIIGMTERKKTELKLLKKDIELKQKEKILLEILDSSTAGTYVIDYKEETVIYSEQWTKRLGLEFVPSNRLLQTFHQRVLPEDLMVYLRTIHNSALNNEPRYISEFRIRDKNNDVIWVLEQGKLVYDEKGKLSKGYGTFMDIISRKRHESQIKRQNKILQAINDIYEKAIPCKNVEELGQACLRIAETVMESKFSFIGMIGEDGRLHDIAISDGWELSKMSDTTGLGIPPRDFIIQGLYGGILLSGQSLLTNEPSMHPDSTGTPKGHPTLTAFLGVPFLHDSKVIGMIAVANREGGFRGEDKEMLEALAPTIMEVLLRKRTEVALKKSETQARFLVEELKTVDKNKNTFLNSLSHELRNPLAAVSVGLELLDITQDKNQTDKAKEVIKRQLNQLCHLVDDLLDLTRITNNKIELKKEKVDLNKAALSIADDYKTHFEKKGVELATDISSNSIFVHADPVRLAQIIGNLLHNALKFTDMGGKTILKVYYENDVAVIDVEDTGIGIKPEFLPGLFEPFKQLDSSLDRHNGGLGLGLSIVKSIAELHGGSVKVQSCGLGKGSVFSICLPLCDIKVDKKTEQYLNHRHTSRMVRILLIEDNQDLASLLCSMFVMMGHEAVAAHDGFKGIKQAKDYKPDVIFCDIGLPGMNGFEVAKRIREDDSLNELFLVALTGYAGQKDLELATEAGFNLHLAKPVDVASLKGVLDKVPIST